ncbi:hypothetical protein BBJ28_00025256, partial [Nothophytophthora sp. Chile5]
LGKPLSQMELRFKDVSISADIVVKDESQTTVELPTIPNVIKSAVARMSAKKRVVKKQILRNVSGVFKPSTITLVLGQPGSGKSSLMKLLSGRFPVGRRVKVEGEITYNGASQKEMRKQLPQLVSYVTQQDQHFPTLTVKETLEFAHACSGGGLSKRDEQHFVNGTTEENQAALEAARALFKHHPDVVIQQLGLENCQNTIVGNAMLRGVSGGERKRVTMGEMEFGNKYVMMMDEISTGLDSAATFDIISTQRSLAKRLRKTVVISLLQPSPEVFALFDDVILLNDGYVMFHGPRDQALDYFESLDFKCPPSRDVADFLMDLGTNKQQQYAVGTVPTTASQFAEVFERSGIHEQMVKALNVPLDPVLLQDKQKHMDPLPEFHQGFCEGTLTLMRRQMMVTIRNTALLKSRFFMSIVLGLLNASTFYQFNEVDAQLVMGIAYVAVNFVSLGQAAQVPTFMAIREVFNKQRGANFFRTSSFVLATSVSQIPLAVIETLIFGSIMYWMCGLVLTAGGFLLFELMLFLISMAFAAWFFFLAVACADLNVANPISMLSLLFFTMFAGFVIPMGQIPDYLIWLYWISPLAWGIRALAVNQYTDTRFAVCEYQGVDYCGTYGMTMSEYSLSSFDVPTERFWLWYGIVFLVGVYLFFMVTAWFVLEYWRSEEPKHVSLSIPDDDVSADTSSSTAEYGALVTPKTASVKANESLDVMIPVPMLPNVRKFVQVTVAFQDLWYSVPDPAHTKENIDLLKGISGFALPGTITALMGSSGAGKTTLMDVIAGRKTGGKTRGQILLNGHPATDLAIRRSTGYCEQMDIHSDASTFREALTFSAFLRQGADVSDAMKFDSVNECLELLDLHPIADQIIRGSSTEQMKRLTIGVELAAQPSVLFLDEPTSGLDARSAKLIMDGVRKVADTGRTIVCTIHQPSSVVFTVFDSLLLLKRGGEMVFFGDLGENASELIDYFEAIDGVAKIEDDYNPATWMLEVTGAGVGNANGDSTDFVALFKASSHHHRLQENLGREGVTRPSPTLPALEFSDKRAASNLVQAKFLVQRFFNLYWRTPAYNLTRIIISVILGLVFGITYVSAQYTSYQGINSGLGMVYMTSSYITFITFNGALPIAYKDRMPFYRERAAQTYNAFWYFAGATLVEIPYCLMSTMIFTTIF